LYAVYDFKNKEYAYVFDENYIGKIENGVLNLNLFEMKISSEEMVNTTTKVASRKSSDGGTTIDINDYFEL
jgi:hypothetical protein